MTCHCCLYPLPSRGLSTPSFSNEACSSASRFSYIGNCSAEDMRSSLIYKQIALNNGLHTLKVPFLQSETHLFLRSDFPVIKESLRINIHCAPKGLEPALLSAAFPASRERESVKTGAFASLWVQRCSQRALGGQSTSKSGV